MVRFLGQIFNINMEPLNYHIIHTYLSVSGISKICKERIEKAALSVGGVSFANWNILDNKLFLTFDPHKTDLNRISQAVAKAGYDTNLHKAIRNLQE